MTGSAHLEMGEGGEFDVIRRLLATWGAQATGIGDDAAVLDIPAGEQLVVSTDASIERVHFRREWMTAVEVGARAAAAALSDLAAMGATPRGLLLALGVPDGWRGELDALAQGVGAVASAAGCPIIGGNISAAGELSLTITALGSARRPLVRSGARAGDTLFVTGRLGGSGAALASLLAGRPPAPEHRSKFVAPMPRLREGRWLAEHGARAAIDISDGLVADASHLARASDVSLVLDDEIIPRVTGVSIAEALVSGEEYELLVATPPGADIRPDVFERLFGVSLTAIGSAVAPGERPVMMRLGAARGAPGHDHFA